MAEVAIIAAVQKIGVALGGQMVKELSSLLSAELALLAELPSRISRIEIELQMMQGFLSQLDMSKLKNPAHEAWIRHVRKQAYTVEDIMDEYVSVVSQQVSGLGGYWKKIGKGPQTLVALHGIAAQLKEIEANLAHLSQMKDRWIQSTSDDRPGSISSDASESQLFYEEEELVGTEEIRRALSDLLDSSEPHLSVITVRGIGGVGKTALVNNVYQAKKLEFDFVSWVSVSQSYRFDKIIRDLIRDINKNVQNHDEMDDIALTRRMRELLSDKKFLIVLDDVWAPAEFLHLLNALRGNNRGLGSRIIITSRIDDVAQLATDDRYRLTIEPLGADPAFLLFCRKAFWKTESRECPSELEECARAIVAECEGLPLAIASMGLFLSSKEQTVPEWTQISKQLDWEWDNNPSLTRTKCVLNISYKALPRYLKNCFLYCSIFPEDYLLSRKKLTRLWIAEGLVEERGPNKTLEEVAESYLKELVGRSMLQLVKKNHFGRVKKFRMHDLVRDLAISLSRKECFHQVYTGGENVRIYHDARRLSLLSCSDTDDKSGIDLPRLRSLIAFDTKMPPSLLLSSVSSKSRYLAVLDLTGLPIETLPDSIGDLFNLRYLGLRCCSNVKSLPKSIGKLSYLQTLDLFGTGIRKLPACIVKCNKLRHLYAIQEIDTSWELFIHGLGVEAPGDVWKLKDLQTFEAVEANGELVGKLARLSQLRTLWIYKLQRTHCAKLCESLSQMNLLSYLFLFARDEHEILELDNLNIASPTLHRLVLKGRLSNGTFNSPLFNGQNNRSLQYINLSWCQLTQLEENQDLIRVLSKLPNLKELILQNVYVGEQDLQFPAGGFALLECLTLRTMPKIAQLRIEGGAMTSLKRLEFDGLQGLQGSPAGIESLQSLKELHLYDVNCCEEIRRRFAGTGRTIPRIYS